MNSSISKDESLSHFTHDDFKGKELKRRYSNFSIRNNMGNTHIFQSPAKLNQSISKLNKKKSSNKFERNDLKEYLQFHKFAIQRNFLNNPNKDNKNECISMIYYREDKNNQNLKKMEMELKAKEKPNLNKIENSLINKINNMKFNMQNKGTSLNTFVDNKIIDLNNSLKSNQSNKNISSTNSHSNNNAIKKKDSNSLSNFKNSNINSNTSNYRSSIFAHYNNSNLSHGINFFNKRSSEIIHVPFEKIKSDIGKKTLKLTEFNKKKKINQQKLQSKI